jgi:uncharacterized BrkB/YihY/UPF0761 family membrane protein
MVVAWIYIVIGALLALLLAMSVGGIDNLVDKLHGDREIRFFTENGTNDSKITVVLILFVLVTVTIWPYLVYNMINKK